MKNRKVAVTGSTGLLGSHLVAELLRRGYTDIMLPLRSLERLPALAATLRREGFDAGDPALNPFETALNDPHGLREAFRGADTVFHCAAVVSMSNDNGRELIEVNVEITDHVVNAAAECGVRCLVHTSSVAALGDAAPGRMFIDENCELENFSSTSPYGISKFLSENRAWRGLSEGLRVVVVNPGIILGEGDWTSGGSTLIIPFAASGVSFFTEGVMGYVDVRDAARAEADLSLCDKAAGERFILVSENLSYRELITNAAAIAGKKPPRINAGKFLMGAAWRGDRLIAKLTGREPSLTKAAAESSLRKSFYDGSKIKKYLPDFKYTPIGYTLDRVVKSYKNETRDT